MSTTKDYWERLSEKVTEPGQTKNKRPDTSDLEIAFMRDYLSVEDELLDLGAGTGLITNKLVGLVKHITAVEKYETFTNFIDHSENVLVVNADLRGFKMRKHFDVILLTGVGQCFQKEVTADIYMSAFEMLRPGGLFVNRIHCGLSERIVVDGWSEELQTDYFAEYRPVDEEEALLKTTGFQEVSRHDFLPDTINVWPNSRHFYFICKR